MLRHGWALDQSQLLVEPQRVVIVALAFDFSIGDEEECCAGELEWLAGGLGAVRPIPGVGAREGPLEGQLVLLHHGRSVHGPDRIGRRIEEIVDDPGLGRRTALDRGANGSIVIDDILIKVDGGRGAVMDISGSKIGVEHQKRATASQRARAQRLGKTHDGQGRETGEEQSALHDGLPLQAIEWRARVPGTWRQIAELSRRGLFPRAQGLRTRLPE